MKSKWLDTGSTVTIAATLILFTVALFVKGLTHDLLLEAAVFLVSVKLVLLSHQNRMAAEAIREELRALRGKS